MINEFELGRILTMLVNDAVAHCCGSETVEYLEKLGCEIERDSGNWPLPESVFAAIVGLIYTSGR